MRGVVLPGGSRVELRQFPDPQPGIGQVVVRMKASSICGSDVRAIYREHLGKGAEGYVDGTIGGHEPCGQVEEIGPGVTSVKPGDRVAIYHIAGCGHCRDCRVGFMISCSSRAEPRTAGSGTVGTPTSCSPRSGHSCRSPTSSATLTARSSRAASLPPGRGSSARASRAATAS